MHNAPAVSYPVGRSRLQGKLLSAISVFGFACAFVWISQADAVGWRQWLMLSCTIWTAFGAWWQWRQAVAGQLVWDGVVWTWVGAQASESVQMRLIADVQGAMLLRLDVVQGHGRRWTWVDQESSPGRWLALRRAVHQRPRQHTDPLVNDQPRGVSPL